MKTNERALEPYRVPAASWYALAVLTFIDGCHYLDRSVISIVAEPIRREFHLADSQLGLLTGLAYGISFALAGLPFGYLIDRVNRRRLLALAVITWSSMTALVAGAQSYVVMLGARVLLGAAEAAGSPASMSLIADLFPAKLRSTALGIHYLSSAIGAAASAIIAAAVAAKYGWRAVFLAAGIPGIMLGILMWTTVRDVARGASETRIVAAAAPKLRVVFPFLLRQASVLSLIAAIAATAAGVAAIGAWLPPLLMRRHGMAISSAGFVTALAFGLFSSLGTLFGGLIADALARGGAPRRLWFCAAMALLTVPAGVTAAVASSTPLVVCSAFMAALFAFTIFPSGFGIAMEPMPPQMRGMTTACALVTSNLVGYGIGPYAVGLISTGVGGSESLGLGIGVVSGTAMLVAMIALIVGALRHPRDMLRRAAYEATLVREV